MTWFFFIFFEEFSVFFIIIKNKNKTNLLGIGMTQPWHSYLCVLPSDHYEQINRYHTTSVWYPPPTFVTSRPKKPKVRRLTNSPRKGDERLRGRGKRNERRRKYQTP